MSNFVLIGYYKFDIIVSDYIWDNSVVLAKVPTIVKSKIIKDRCKDQFRLRSNTGMDPGPRSPNNEFVECGKKS